MVAPAARGRFIVLEGGEASGKSTQAARLATRLRATGHDVVETFEPGATDVGARVRELLLDGPDEIAPLTEALLLAADRAQHVAEVVEPALARGADVISDRYVPSSLVYQGVGRDLGVETIRELSELATGGLDPDLVVVLDVGEAVAAVRQQGRPDRLERAGVDFHARVRTAYRQLAATLGWTVVDGAADPEVVAERVWVAISKCLPT